MTRTSQRGYWCSTKGGYLTIDELAAIQGFTATSFPWKEAGLSEHAAGAAIGNGQTFSLVADLVPHVLFHSSIITLDQFKVMTSRG